MELRRLERLLKRCNKKEKELLRERIERLKQKERVQMENNFDVILNTVVNEKNKIKDGKAKRKAAEKIRAKLVKKGEIEDKLFLAGRNKLDDAELQDFPITEKAPENIRQVGTMNKDLIRNRFSSIFKRGLVEYTKPKVMRRKKMFKLHKGHSTRPDYNQLDADKNTAIKKDTAVDDLKIIDDQPDVQKE